MPLFKAHAICEGNSWTLAFLLCTPLLSEKASDVLAHLDGFLVDFVRSSTELLQSPIGILSVYHHNVGTATWRDHLKSREGEN